MKRFLAINCSLLLIFLFASCKNLTLTEKNRNTDSGKGTVYIQIPDGTVANRAAIVQNPGDVRRFTISLVKDGVTSPVFEKSYAVVEINQGVKIEIDSDDYTVAIEAYDGNGIIFEGKTEEPVHVTIENTADNPAVVSVFMKMVLACYDTGSEALVRYNGNTVLDGNVVPDVLVPVVQRLPEGNRTAANGYVITGWKDSNNGNQVYDAEEPIDLDGKKLPLRLTAVWGEPETGYAGSFANTRYYQYSDVLWNSPLETTKAFCFTVTGNQLSGSVSAEDCAFLMLKDMTASDGSLTADIYKYSGESDGDGIKVGSDSYTIGAVTKYGVVISQGSSTFFLFTGEGLNHYNALTADEVSDYRMSSAMIINAPISVNDIHDALDAFGGYVGLRTEDDLINLMNDTSDGKYTERYAVLQDITVTELPKSLFEKKFNGYFDGQGHTITVTAGNAPLFKDIGESGEVCNLTLKGNFSSYAEPYRDFGVFCSNNYGKLHDCSFEGTAPTATGIGTVSVFGYQAPGSTYSSNTKSSSAAETSTMYQITMIPITGATVSESIGDGAFASASLETPVTVGNFLIAEAEVTYAQWRDVYDWAKSNGYTFSSNTLTGRPGDKGTDGAELTTANATIPVTEISYSDILVWCNAASEKQGLEPVYYDSTDSSKVLRDTTSSFSIAATSNSAADGYRLPEQKEWEYAARGGNPDDTTAWNYTYAGTNDPQGYAVQYNLTDANGKTYSQMAYVKTLIPNTAGLYDMSGNAGEYFYPKGESSCYYSSSRNTSKNSITVDYKTWTTTRDVNTGFRVVRSIVN